LPPAEKAAEQFRAYLTTLLVLVPLLSTAGFFFFFVVPSDCDLKWMLVALNFPLAFFR